MSAVLVVPEELEVLYPAYRGDAPIAELGLEPLPGVRPNMGDLTSALSFSQ